MRHEVTKHRGALVGVALSATLVLAACSGKGNGGVSGAAASGSSGSSASVSSAAVSGLGTVLTNGSGHTLYLFTPEKGAKVACTGSCATTWPAVTLPSGTTAATAGSGVDSSLFGTVKLAAGGVEVTYNGWPLHTYVGDSGPGQANGQGIQGTWFAVTTAGTAASSGSTSGSGGGGYGSGGNSGYGSTSGSGSSGSGW